MVAPTKVAKSAPVASSDTKTATKKKIVKNVKTSTKTAATTQKKSATTKKAPTKRVTKPKNDQVASPTSDSATDSTAPVVDSTASTVAVDSNTTTQPKKTQTKRVQSNQAKSKKASKPKKASASSTGPKKTIKKKAATRKPKAVKVDADSTTNNDANTATAADGSTTTAPSQSKKRKSSKRRGAAKPRIHIPRGIHNIIESVRKYEERIRQLSDDEFKVLDNSYISSYTIWIDPKTWKMETVKAKAMTPEEREAKPCFLTQLETMDELMGHALHYSDVNSAIIEGLRMMVLIKVASERGVNILGIVGEKQSQVEPKGPKHWKLDPKEGRSKVVTHLEDGGEVVDSCDDNGNTVRLLNGQPVVEKQLPKMNWNGKGARVCYVGGIQRFPFDRPLFASKFALKNSDYVKYKPVEYKEFVDSDVHFKDIPLASQYPLLIKN